MAGREILLAHKQQGQAERKGGLIYPPQAIPQALHDPLPPETWNPLRCVQLTADSCSLGGLFAMCSLRHVYRSSLDFQTAHSFHGLPICTLRVPDVRSKIARCGVHMKPIRLLLIVNW